MLAIRKTKQKSIILLIYLKGIKVMKEKQKLIMELNFTKERLKHIKKIDSMEKEIKELKLIIQDIQYDIELINKR